MVKAIEFWNYLCKELDYRFFAGVACEGLSSLYKKMNANIMHYIPAANERIALGLVSGAQVAGFKAGLLLDMRFAYDLTSMLEFNVSHRIPFLVVGYSEKEAHLVYDFPEASILDNNYQDALKQVTSKSESELVPGLVVIGKGVLS